MIAMRPAALMILATLLAALPAPWAMAQAKNGSLRPVDPIVEDIDPLQRSLRRLEPGIGAPGVDSDSKVYQDNSTGGDPTRFYYIRPGIIAQYNRSDYATVEVHKQLVTYQAVGPNTIYLLGGIPRTVAPAQDASPNPLLVQTRVDGRVDDAAPPNGDEADSGLALAQQRQSYRRFRDSQRRIVLSALDKAVSSAPKAVGSSPASPQPDKRAKP